MAALLDVNSEQSFAPTCDRSVETRNGAMLSRDWFLLYVRHITISQFPDCGACLCRYFTFALFLQTRAVIDHGLVCRLVSPMGLSPRRRNHPWLENKCWAHLISQEANRNTADELWVQPRAWRRRSFGFWNWKPTISQIQMVADYGLWRWDIFMFGRLIKDYYYCVPAWRIRWHIIWWLGNIMSRKIVFVFELSWK